MKKWLSGDSESRDPDESNVARRANLCWKKMTKKFLFFEKKKFRKNFLFFFIFFIEALPFRVENLSVGWRAGETRFLVKICVFGGQNCTSKRGFFVQNRDFSKLRSQLSADTIPPIYIVFKMPPKTAPRTCLGVPKTHPRPDAFFSCFFPPFFMRARVLRVRVWCVVFISRSKREKVSSIG